MGCQTCPSGGGSRGGGGGRETTDSGAQPAFTASAFSTARDAETEVIGQGPANQGGREASNGGRGTPSNSLMKSGMTGGGIGRDAASGGLCTAPTTGEAAMSAASNSARWLGSTGV